METAIGVFASRDRAARAVGELLNQQVPEQSIVFLTRSESEAQTVGTQFGAGAGASTGVTVGIAVGAAAALLVPVSERYSRLVTAPPLCLDSLARV